VSPSSRAATNAPPPLATVAMCKVGLAPGGMVEPDHAPSTSRPPGLGHHQVDAGAGAADHEDRLVAGAEIGFAAGDGECRLRPPCMAVSVTVMPPANSAAQSNRSLAQPLGSKAASSTGGMRLRRRRRQRGSPSPPGLPRLCHNAQAKQQLSTVKAIPAPLGMA
jgi:hypothetical protein